MVPITHERQIESLSRAAEVQGEGRSLIPENKTWAQFKDSELRDTREALQENSVKSLHDLRAAYTSERYQALTGERPPLEGVEGRRSRSA